MKNKPLLLIFLVITSCTLKPQIMPSDDIKLLDKESFEKEVNGKQVSIFTLTNKLGSVAQITNYGGKVASLWVQDKSGKYEDVVLGHTNIDDYLISKEKYFGALIGRYGNRIKNGEFSLDSSTYNLKRNNGDNHLHGGDAGFDAVVWNVEETKSNVLELSYVSENMEEGYPGTLSIRVNYELTDDNELKIEYWATTDASTVVNLTHHSFFNLKGAGNGTINEHLLRINAPYYTPVDEGLIPTGILATVEGTPFDFQKLTAIGERVDQIHPQLKNGKGYDHNFVLNQNFEELNYAAKVIEPVSGRVMEVFTNEPGLQFYGGNFLNGSVTGKENKAYKFRTAFCLETQHFPDSPNKPHFPSTRLDPGEDYYSVCIYKFSTVK
jgi:aldose 1-epimerase